MPRIKKEEELPVCPICGEEMRVEYNCRMDRITGQAGWHMFFEPRMKMCGKCSKKLLEYIEKWYIKVNKTDNYTKPYAKPSAEIERG